ncbi:MAG: ATP-binding cassette domain-containing protein [Anaerolineae bacterium]|nr:ATP-binding cassette domain-containing protein [Thermoflexales bacterium]MDW8406780.1 ATP-binding cassette domain-containing protein [Anaerolineae bacterium]
MNTTVISVSHLAKSFGAAKAVQDVSFDVHAGEIFGLLGPNGAGKTTTIRIILDIFRPDQGTVSVLGGPMSEDKKARIGYLPEERGLYKDLTVERCVTYLAELKGVPHDHIKTRAAQFFERFDLADHRRKKINDLSKGMQQKVQIIATLLHRPELLIIDEPFSGLDPVNTRLVQDMLLEQRAQGATIVMSTHQMHQVEEMCDRLVLIDHGRTVLYGTVDEIRRQYADRAVRVTTKSPLPVIAGVVETSRRGNEHTLALPHGMEPQEVLQQLIAAGVLIEQFELALPTMDDIFVKVVAGEARQAPNAIR